MNLYSKESKLILIFSDEHSGVNLVSSAGKYKLSKAMVAMLFPVLIVITISGWCLYWIGDQKRQDELHRKQLKKETVNIMPVVYEETPEIINY